MPGVLYTFKIHVIFIEQHYFQHIYMQLTL